MPLFKTSHRIIRPIPVTILAAIWGTLGFLLLTVGMLCLLAVVWIYGGESGALTKVFPKADIVELMLMALAPISLGIISTLASIPAISACFGLMKMKRSGILGGNSASGIFFLFNIITFPFTLASSVVVFNVAFAGLSIFTWIYLNRKRIRRQFS
jgi:hypothetical protein